MRLVTVKVPEIYLEGIDELVKLGRYSSRSEVIRTAIRDLLRRELWMNKTVDVIGPQDIDVATSRGLLIRKIRLI